MMRRVFPAFLLFAVLFARGTASAGAGGMDRPSFEAQPPGGMTRLYVTISPRARVGGVAERVGAFGDVREIDAFARLGVIVLDIPPENLDEQMERIRNTSGVRYVETEQYVYADATIPNDPDFPVQYALTAIRAPQGWDYSTGSVSVTIAIVDGGVDPAHVDLAGKLVPGYDFVDNDTTPYDLFYGHGTHVAGIAAAAGNNNAGIAGVSWGARVMPVRVLNSSGGGTFANVALGIQWAVDNGAEIINLSLGGTAYSAVLENAVAYAYANNVLLVAAAGNTGSSFVLYPARFSQVIAVGATNQTNLPASFSNYGAEVDIAAPGDTILSALPGGYGVLSGTSMAAPHVSGLASILFGYISSAGDVRAIMESTALDVGPAGWDMFSGAGLIQMDAAIAQVAPPLPTPTHTLLPTKTFTPAPLQREEDDEENRESAPAGVVPMGSLPLFTATFTLPPTVEPASATPANSPREGEAEPSFTLTPTSTEEVSAQQTFDAGADSLHSPWLCAGALMLALGVGLFWLARRRRY